MGTGCPEAYTWLALSLCTGFSRRCPMPDHRVSHNFIHINQEVPAQQGRNLADRSSRLRKLELASYALLTHALYTGFSTWLCTQGNHASAVMRHLSSPFPHPQAGLPTMLCTFRAKRAVPINMAHGPMSRLQERSGFPTCFPALAHDLPTLLCTKKTAPRGAPCTDTGKLTS
jgi:hypothetical protein